LGEVASGLVAGRVCEKEGGKVLKKGEGEAFSMRGDGRGLGHCGN